MRLSNLRGASRALVIVTAVMAGCATNRPLMPTPTLYATALEEPYGPLPAEFESNTVDVLFVTDRNPERNEDGSLAYGIQRSPSMAFGSATVVLGEDQTWPSLVEDAQSATRKRPINLSLRGIEELGRGPGTPLLFEMVDGQAITLPEAQAALDAAIARFREDVKRRLALTDRKEVFIYVHGVGNSFEDAMFTTAELWHFLGREGVPIAYTWPAGGTGITGYTYDRESSEFTITHMKHFLKLLTEISEVEKVHLIAHSRGTDVVSTSLRELLIASRAAGEDFRQRFRIDNVVLAAPDLDLGVTMQRSASERVGLYVGRITLYSSQQDRAIGVAQWLFGEDLRLGRLDADNAPEALKAILKKTPRFAIVEYRGEKAGNFGHNYFRTNPAVASDMLLTVRYDRDPGAENGRPLEHKGLIFWEIGDDYLTGGP